MFFHVNKIHVSFSNILGGVPMTTQPGMPAPPGAQPVVWMTRPQPIPGCPPGLEYLTTIDQLIVKQQIELLESRFKIPSIYSSCGLINASAMSAGRTHHSTG